METVAHEVARAVSVLKKLREDFEIGLGCVGTEPGVIDTAEQIYGRVKKALQYLPPERITLNPDCGFAPGSAAKVSIDDSANDGEPKEGDNVRSDVENVYGGAGNDLLVGSAADADLVVGWLRAVAKETYRDGRVFRHGDVFPGNVVVLYQNCARSFTTHRPANHRGNAFTRAASISAISGDSPSPVFAKK